MRYDLLEAHLVSLFGKDKDENGELIPEFFDIKVCPEFEKDYTNWSIEKPQVFCSYDESNYMNTEPTDAIFQEDSIKIGFDIRARLRSGENGIFAVRDRIQKVILGYKMAGYDKFQLILFTPIIPKKDEPSTNDWHYYLQFSTTTHICEDQPDEIAYLLKTPEFVNKT